MSDKMSDKMSDIINDIDHEEVITDTIINNIEDGSTEKEELLSEVNEENKRINYNSINENDIQVNIENLETVFERVEISKIGYVMFVVFGLTMLCAW